MGIRGADKLQARIVALMERLWNRLDLGWLSMDNTFSPAKSDTDRIVCQTQVDWEYRQVVFTWTLLHAATVTDRELELIAVHEVVHALIAPLWEELPDKWQERLHSNNELATENVARCLYRLWEGF